MKSARVRPAISAALPWETCSISYHLTAAAIRISWANSSGVLRRAENAVSGRLRVMLVMVGCWLGIVRADELNASWISKLLAVLFWGGLFLGGDESIR